MATLLTELSSKLNLTSSINTLTLVTGVSSEYVTLSLEASLYSHELIFETSVATYNNAADKGEYYSELDNVGEIIEEYLIEKGRQQELIGLYLNGALVVEFPVLYCAGELNPLIVASLPDKVLSLSKSALVSRDGIVDLTILSNESKAPEVRAVGLDLHGRLSSCTKGLEPAIHLREDVPHILDRIAGEVLSEVFYFTVHFGGTEKVYFLTDNKPCARFSFKNIFNADETLDVFGVITDKAEYERSIASCSGVASQYDRTVKNTFEIKTGPIGKERWLELLQLIGSRSVQVQDGDRWIDVLITDHTLEYSDNNQDLASLTFSFRAASSGKVIFTENLSPIKSVTTNIFTEPFTDQFD